MNGSSTSVVIVDDHRLVRESLGRALADRGIRVVGEASDGVSAVTLVAGQRPDVVLMDVSMRDGDGITATREIMRLDARNRVVILTMHGDAETLRRALQAGAVGFVTKDSPIDDVVEAIRLATAGEVLVNDRLATAFIEAAAEEGPNLLSQRETEVLQLCANGLSTTEIAGRLYISQKTLKNHLASVYAKLDARDRTHAVVIGVRMGIVDLN